uniref:Uncharacterized protein n=1 Tax=Kuenenia stuttgartiensis TaxID=174633 RepID=Q1PV75_KUEST|nr:unknown protein [Candidatus Kuenenia stuttgartiensis]
MRQQTFGQKEERIDNKGFKEIGGSVVNQTFVHLTKGVNGVKPNLLTLTLFASEASI